MIGNEDQELEVYPHGPDSRWFRAEQPFEVDSVVYDWAESSHTSRLIVSTVSPPLCSCESRGVRCVFDVNADRFTDVPDSLGDAYRWSPGTVYYRSTEFDTRPKGQ